MVPLIVLAVFMGFALLIMWRPASILALALCIYPFEQWAQAKSVIFVQHSTIINYCLGLLTLFALAVVTLRGKNPLNPITGSWMTWLALYIFAGVSVIWSPDRETSVFLYRYHLPYVVTFVGLLPMVITDTKDLRFGLLLTLMFGTCVMLLLLGGTHIHAWGRTIEVEHGVALTDRFDTRQITRLAPLAIAGTAAHILLIAILLNFTGINRVWQVGRWFVAFMALALIFRSGSRGQLLAAVATLVTFIALSRGFKRFTGIAFAGIAVLIMGIFLVVSFGTYADPGGRWDVSTMEESFKSTRVEYVTKLFGHWAESGPQGWLFGLGSSASYDNRILGNYCHVVIAEMLCELGFVGLGGFLLYLGFVARDSFRLYRACADDLVERGVAATAIAIFCFQLILTMKEGSFLTHTYTLGWGIVISRYAALKLAEQKKFARVAAVRRWYAFQLAAAQQQPLEEPRPVTS